MVSFCQFAVYGIELKVYLSLFGRVWCVLEGNKANRFLPSYTFDWPSRNDEWSRLVEIESRQLLTFAADPTEVSSKNHGK